MKAKFPHFALCLVALVALAGSSCNRAAQSRFLKFGIQTVTHVAVGQSIQLSAYQEYTRKLSSYDAVQAAAGTEVQREPVGASWSVSDASVASINSSGMLTAIKPGVITVKGSWGEYESTIKVAVIKGQSFNSLPQISAQGMKCSPGEVELNLDGNRTLRFRMGFGDSRCADLTIATETLAQPLPWKFEFAQGTLELKSASGKVVTGEVSYKEGGTVRFTTWSEGEGVYPVSLSGKRVLLIGDSMAEGIGWFLRGKVEVAGGVYIGEPWCSSTTYSWYETGRFNQMLERHKPDVVFIALGSNEIFNKQAETSAPIIRQMVERLGSRPAYWIGPPSWKPDQGIVRVIEENFQPNHFYNSNDLQVPRRKDKAHPTKEGYDTWTNLVWNWYAGLG